MCNCVSNVNRQLRDTGHKVATARFKRADGTLSHHRVLVRTLPEDGMPSGRRPPIALATHCPYCGTKYEERAR